MVKLHINRNTYYDSVTLMLISKDLKQLSGIKEAIVGMGTDLNKEISRNIGLDSPELENLTSNDFFVAISCEKDSDLQVALDKVEELLNQKKQASAANYYPPTLKSALKIMPELNMAIIAIPGKYAAEVAQDCLENNINVMMFSDNVTIEEERKLKEFAAKKELLMMGPDCGTAIINNVPLAFANVVKSGDIGIVAASGTGTQEVSTLIDQLGCGVSQVIGTGGRDLKLEIGGIMFELALDALINDDATKVIVMISKPPAKEIQTKILNKALSGGKPTVVCFIGGNPQEVVDLGLISSVSLEDAAHKAKALSKGEPLYTFDKFTISDEEINKIVESEIAHLAPEQKYLRGLYTGGTLCDEAMKLTIASLGHIYSNIPLSSEDKIANKDISYMHTCLDFGDDEFTVGRPHPMIDLTLRSERVIKEATDPETAVILLDCVIGYGANADPATDTAKSISEAKAIAKANNRAIVVIASICGTELDPQSLSISRKTLEDVGAIVMPSNAQAVRFANLVVNAIK